MQFQTSLDSGMRSNSSASRVLWSFSTHAGATCHRQEVNSPLDNATNYFVANPTWTARATRSPQGTA